MPRGTCYTAYGSRPLRAELEEAHAEMDKTDEYFAFAVGRTYDGMAWEVNIRAGNIYMALTGSHLDSEKAKAAGEEWLQEQMARELSAAELWHQMTWKECQQG